MPRFPLKRLWAAVSYKTGRGDRRWTDTPIDDPLRIGCIGQPSPHWAGENRLSSYFALALKGKFLFRKRLEKAGFKKNKVTAQSSESLNSENRKINCFPQPRNDLLTVNRQIKTNVPAN